MGGPFRELVQIFGRYQSAKSVRYSSETLAGESKGKLVRKLFKVLLQYGCFEGILAKLK